MLDDSDDIPFDSSPPHYGPELPDWWQLALLGYDVACHVPLAFSIDHRPWDPSLPQQLGPDWFLIAIGIHEVVHGNYEDGEAEIEYYDASFWARRPHHVQGPTALTFVDHKSWAKSYPIELEAQPAYGRLAVYFGDDT